MSGEASLEDVERAREVVADVIRPTQLIESRFLSRTTAGTIALKAENLQRTGSFKLRGVLNKIASLEPGTTRVVTASAGNHGQSLALGETGVELVMETRGPDHAERLIRLITESGYSARVLD